MKRTPFKRHQPIRQSSFPVNRQTPQIKAALRRIGRNDWMKRNGGYKLNGEHVQRSRLRIDTRKWHLSKMLPKVYGDKPVDDAQDEDGGRTIRIIGGLPDE